MIGFYGGKGGVWCFYGGKGDALCSWLAGAPATEAKRVHCAHGRLECQPSSWKLVDLNYLTDCTVCEVIRSTNLTSWFRARNPPTPASNTSHPIPPTCTYQPHSQKGCTDQRIARWTATASSSTGWQPLDHWIGRRDAQGLRGLAANIVAQP